MKICILTGNHLRHFYYADKLANIAIGQEYVPYKKKVKEKKRIYLNVPFGEKDGDVSIPL